ncbi:MAG: CopG family antitoxin [Candidatus Roizmanbacteria bacterium]
MKYYELTKEEEQILKDYDKGRLIPVSDSASRVKEHVSFVKYTLNKTKNINIRLSERVVQKLKTKAAEMGIPYQTLASSILHRYSSA